MYLLEAALGFEDLFSIVNHSKDGCLYLESEIQREQSTR